MSTLGSQLEGLLVSKSIFPVHQVYGQVGSQLLSEPTVALANRSVSELSSVYMRQAMASCRWLFMHCTPWAFSLARVRAGSSSAARIAIMAITTSNSMSVNPPERREMFLLAELLLLVILRVRSVVCRPRCEPACQSVPSNASRKATRRRPNTAGLKESTNAAAHHHACPTSAIPHAGRSSPRAPIPPHYRST